MRNQIYCKETSAKLGVWILLTFADMYDGLNNVNQSHLLTLFTDTWFNYMTRIGER
jgi:hypothetical protein